MTRHLLLGMLIGGAVMSIFTDIKKLYFTDTKIDYSADCWIESYGQGKHKRVCLKDYGIGSFESMFSFNEYEKTIYDLGDGWSCIEWSVNHD